MLTDKLKDIIKDCWADFQKLNEAAPGCLVENSVPILWFGDLEAYSHSPKRVLTLSMNPADREFTHQKKKGLKRSLYNSELRFPRAATLRANAELSDADVQSYYESMNEYFSVNPYASWSDAFTKVLLPTQSAYARPGESCTNVALHLNVLAPVATTPDWNKLEEADQIILQDIFRGYFKRLIDELKPDVLFVTEAETQLKFVFNLEADRCVHNFKKPFSKKFYINAYDGVDGFDCAVISGSSHSGVPFGGMTDEQLSAEVSDAWYRICN